jgi:hypothetical protein
MWDQYRKTFAGMQAFIVLVTLALFIVLGYRLAPTLVFFAAMQVSALLGAMWATRLRRKFQGRAL